MLQFFYKKMKNFKIKSTENLSQKALTLGLHSYLDLVNSIQKIPYGRNSERGNLELVFTENRGTCSSKHALIQAIATENNFNDLKLILGIYKMTVINTPNIGNVISENHLSYLPEAHCYLKYQNETIDITTAHSDFEKIKNSIIEELEIKPFQIEQFKIDYHKNFIQKWIIQEKIPFTAAEIWVIREKCISNLEKFKAH